ncbi:serine protease inhibitor 28Dc-like isoform X1 [Drosophila sulfurigaster albostrigata]|uniref:serine protease inhibitor 28Dc-like isoform X1 n=1 Tax=Drosophila sulfurigaster albostrigata TaxID=89887 RepID=UPI002D21B624|nr:serine protease inhibitor 28Dc-like isoform X1 [Drosophila sulfurigaster albostrigata]
MLRCGALLTFIAYSLLFATGHCDKLWSDIRSPQNQAELQQFYAETDAAQSWQSSTLISRPSGGGPFAQAVQSAGGGLFSHRVSPGGGPFAQAAPSSGGGSLAQAAPSAGVGPFAQASPSAGGGSLAQATPSSGGGSLAQAAPSAGGGQYSAPSQSYPPLPVAAPSMAAIPATPQLVSPGLVASLPPPRRAPTAAHGGAAAGDNVDVVASDQIARNLLSFAQNLSQQIGINYHKTTIFSPLSIASALALILLGAKGRSYSELSQLFGQTDVVQFHQQFGLMMRDIQQPTKATTSPVRQLDNWHSDSVRKSLRNYPRNRSALMEVHIANGLFLQRGYSLNPDYRQAITQVYNSELQEVDFERQPATAKYAVNSFVDQHTKGKIPFILTEDLPESTRIILANALYFKAMWEIDFVQGATKVDNFYPNGEGNQPVLPVEMMVSAGAFPYHEDPQLSCRIVGLPYHGNLTTMYIIQPLRSSVEQLGALQQRLTADAIEQMISQMTRRSTILAFPKMHLTEGFKLSPILQAMGINGIFSPLQSDLSLIASPGSRPARSQDRTQSSANGFASLYNLEAQRQAAHAQAQSQPTPPSDLIVSDVLHKVDFVVNEQGTEAAAASVAILKKSGPEIVFRAETPFIILVRHDLTKVPLFYGIINEPPTARGATSAV